MLDLKSVSDSLGTILRALTPKITVAAAITAWVLFFIHLGGWMALPQLVVVSALVIGIFSTCLVFTSFVAWLWKAVRPVREAVVTAAVVRAEKVRIKQELAFLTPDERHILAYLLSKNQKMFEVQPDGEKAATLMAKGFLVVAKGPPLIHRDIIVKVPEHVWDVLIERKSDFQYGQPADGKETHPWRIPWMAR